MSRFEREIRNFNIATLGHRNNDLPALNIVIANTLYNRFCTGDEYAGNSEDYVVDEKIWEVPFSAVSVEYETYNRHYFHKEFLNFEEQAKNMILQEFDGAILVVDAQQGITSNINEQLQLAQKVGMRYLTVFVDNCDQADEDQKWQLEGEIRELLDMYEYCGDDTPIVCGSAKGAWEDAECEWGDCILELMDMVDEYMPDSEREIDKYFLMPVEDVFFITGRGTVACGRVETGVIKLNDRVEIVGLGANKDSIAVTGIEMFRKLMDSAEVGDNVGLLLRGVDRFEVKRGQVLTRMGAHKAYSQFTAVVCFAEKEKISTLTSAEEFSFWFRTAGFQGTVTSFDSGMDNEKPYVEVNVKLSDSVAMNPGLIFAVNDKYRNTIGVGKVVETL